MHQPIDVEPTTPQHDACDATGITVQLLMEYFLGLDWTKVYVHDAIPFITKECTRQLLPQLATDMIINRLDLPTICLTDFTIH